MQSHHIMILIHTTLWLHYDCSSTNWLNVIGNCIELGMCLCQIRSDADIALIWCYLLYALLQREQNGPWFSYALFESCGLVLFCMWHHWSQTPSMRSDSHFVLLYNDERFFHWVAFQCQNTNLITKFMPRCFLKVHLRRDCGWLKRGSKIKT